jgi:hypothetical protein
MPVLAQKAEKTAWLDAAVPGALAMLRAYAELFKR